MVGELIDHDRHQHGCVEQHLHRCPVIGPLQRVEIVLQKKQGFFNQPNSTINLGQ
jgi:hypothetical protein